MKVGKLRLGKDVILEAFKEYLNDDFKRTRKDANPAKIINPHFYKQGTFISVDRIDKYGNIIYRETQPGTTPDFEYHIISIAVNYDYYRPYHKKWLRAKERDSKIEQILA